MRQIIIGFTIGFVLASAWVAFAKTEFGSSDAESAVGYGYNGSALVAIQVDSNGVVQTGP